MHHTGVTTTDDAFSEHYQHTDTRLLNQEPIWIQTRSNDLEAASSLEHTLLQFKPPERGESP